MNEAIDLYRVLGVSPRAQNRELAAAARRLAVFLHPDRNPGDIQAEESFKLVQQASTILTDTRKRSEYDAKRREFVKSGQADLTPIISRPATDGEDAQINADIDQLIANDHIVSVMRLVMCTKCLGANCFACEWQGRIEQNKRLRVSLPKNVKTGQILRIKGGGHQGLHGGANGDLLVKLVGSS